MELEATARSAEDAAAALGCRVGQIVKSLVFRGADTGRPGLVLASGPNRVADGGISPLLGEPIGKADAAFVREKTGFAIGGVPPSGHADAPAASLDEDLLKEDEAWAAVGHTHRVPHAQGATRTGCHTHRVSRVRGLRSRPGAVAGGHGCACDPGEVGREALTGRAPPGC